MHGMAHIISIFSHREHKYTLRTSNWSEEFPEYKKILIEKKKMRKYA